MSYHTWANYAHTIDWCQLQKALPIETNRLTVILDEQEIDISEFCEFMDGRDTIATDYFDMTEKQTTAYEIRIQEAWNAVSKAFTRKTRSWIFGRGLILTPAYHDPDSGDRDDDVNGEFFLVDGSEKLTKAGEKGIKLGVQFSSWINSG